MSQLIVCPYCNHRIQLPTAGNETKVGFALSGISGEHSFTKIGKPLNVHCTVCTNHYEYLDMDNFDYIKGKLKLAEDVLEGLKTLDPNNTSPLDLVFANVVGLTRPAHKCLHICIDFNDHRIVLSCREERQFIRATGMYEAY